MANHLTRTLAVEVEFEISRLASQYLIDAYAQVLPEIRCNTKASTSIEPMPAIVKETQS
jgi:hypothetical protein